MKKILFVFNHSFNTERGTPIRVRSLLEQIDARQETKNFSVSRDDKGIGKMKHKKLTGNRISSFFSIYKFIKETDVDIVVFHTIFTAHFLLPLKLFFPKKKFIVEVHGFTEIEMALTENQKRMAYYFYYGFHRIIYYFADSIITGNETASNFLKKYNKNVTTVYGGVDLNMFNPSVCAKSKKSGSDKIVIGYAGNSRKWQGLDFLVMSFLKLKKISNNYRLELLLSDDTEIVHDEDITVLKKVPQKEVANFVSRVDILVIPRPGNLVNTLSMPGKFMEYLASGKPVVCSNTSDMFRIVDHMKNGLIYKADSADNLIECFIKLQDGQLRARIAMKAYITASKYTWNKQSEVFMTALLD